LHSNPFLDAELDEASIFTPYAPEYFLNDAVLIVLGIDFETRISATAWDRDSRFGQLSSRIEKFDPERFALQRRGVASRSKQLLQISESLIASPSSCAGRSDWIDHKPAATQPSNSAVEL